MSAELGPFTERTDGAMAVITARPTSGPAGACLCGFFGQTSIEPPRFTVWLSVQNATYRAASSALALAVHLLPAERHDLAAWFGEQTGDAVDKLAAYATHDGPAGTVLLDELPIRLVGRVVDTVEGLGDHVGFVLDPVEVTGVGDVGRVEGDDGPLLRLADVLDLDPGHPATEP